MRGEEKTNKGVREVSCPISVGIVPLSLLLPKSLKKELLILFLFLLILNLYSDNIEIQNLTNNLKE